MGYNTNQLVLRTGVRPNWLPDERFWYRVTTGVPADGAAADSAPAEFILVDPVARTRQPAFDHAKLAAALSAVAGEKYTADHLPFTEITFSDDARAVSFSAAGKRWRCDVTGAQCGPDPSPAPREQRGGGRGGRGGAGFAPRNDAPSPDGKLAAFIRDYNLWVREPPAARKRSSPPTASRTSATPPTTPAGPTSDRAHRALVARFQEDRHLPAGPARRGRNVPGRDQGRPSHAASLEISAAGRRGGHHHPARHHRRGRPQSDPPADAARPASLHALRRHRLPRRRMGGRRSGIPTARSWPSSPPRAITRRKRCASPTPPPARCATCWTRRSRRSSNPATAASTGTICRPRTKSSGFPSATTGASSISTIWPTGKLKNQITTGDGQRHPDGAGG